jgi:hypothetical protein
LWDIANQCPFAGGTAVYKARAIIAMIIDSVDYYDDNICLQSGIYREYPEELTTISKSNQIEIIPNPASNYFDVILKQPIEGICNITVTTSLQEMVIVDRFECNMNSFRVKSAHLNPGVYFVSVIIDNSIVEIKKLIIIR